MSTLRIKTLPARTPYETYLEERLQSARAFGWRMPGRTRAQHHAPADRPHPAPEFAAPAAGEPA